jgi:hypothetical protein
LKPKYVAGIWGEIVAGYWFLVICIVWVHRANLNARLQTPETSNQQQATKTDICFADMPHSLTFAATNNRM